MVLSDADILKEIAKGRIVIEPLDGGPPGVVADEFQSAQSAERRLQAIRQQVQPASVDLRLGRKLRVFKQHTQGYINVWDEMPDLTQVVTIDELNPFYLHPGEFVLGVTLERVCLPRDIVGRLDGKSSLGRLGLVVHSTAGFVDPGWQGCLTLELSNLAPLPITLYYAMPVSQISFMRLTSPAQQPYGSKKLNSKYQGQDEPAPSRFYLNKPDKPRPKR
ncbi:MAG: dCTP deaminase [Dehalococcoidia bacterium]|nr:dCTP deaminase [Dehalococcoidia bacterium]